MIQCKSCSFLVNDSMKYAMMNNICPACGHGLFSELDKDFISVLQSKILSEKFSHRLTEGQVYDIAIFIFNYLNNDLFELFKRHKENDVALIKPVANEDEIEVFEDFNEDIIRKEVFQEVSEHLNLLDDGEVMPEDVFSKVQKLKKLHKQRIDSNPNLGKEVPIATGKKGSGFRVNRSN